MNENTFHTTCLRHQVSDTRSNVNEQSYLNYTQRTTQQMEQKMIIQICTQDQQHLQPLPPLLLPVEYVKFCVRKTEESIETVLQIHIASSAVFG